MKTLGYPHGIILYSIIAILLLSTDGHCGKKEEVFKISHLRPGDFERFMDSSHANLQIAVESNSILANEGLDKANFDSQITHGFAMYQIHIPCPSRSTGLLDLIEDRDFLAIHKKAWNIKSKFSFFDGDQLLFTIYADPQGNMLLGDMAYASDKNWVPSVWTSIFEDIYGREFKKHK